MNRANLVLDRAEPGILIVKVSRPKALNALNSEVLRELKSVFTNEARDASTRVVILSGDGEKAFVAGADIAEMAKFRSTEAVDFSQLGHEVTALIESNPRPVIAAVNGYALGGGTELAIACDFIVASDKAVFGQPEVGLGVIPGFGGMYRLAKIVGYTMAKDLIYSGRKINADEALRIGLVNQVFPAAEMMTKAIEIARGIAQQSLSAVMEAKMLLNEFSEAIGRNYKADAEAQSFGRLFGGADQVEGMTAFTEKRKPKFQGI